MHHLSSVLMDPRADQAAVAAARQELPAIVAAVVGARRRAPGSDLTSALIAVRDEDGGRLSEPELIGVVLTLMAAGHETTLKLILNAVRALCAHPGQLARARDGTAGWDAVVEETLRYDSPVSNFPFRYPTRDPEPGGTGHSRTRQRPATAGPPGTARSPLMHLAPDRQADLGPGRQLLPR